MPIETVLTDFRAALPTAYRYAFFFDPSTQKVVIEGDAPESAFASILREFAGDAVYRQGTMSIDSGSRSNEDVPLVVESGLVRTSSGC